MDGEGDSAMATSAKARGGGPLAPNGVERAIGYGALAFLFVVLVALGRGRDAWGQVPPLVWTHLLLLLIALAITPVLMLQARGTRRHRALGWTWAAALFATAAVSFGLSGLTSGWSPIHVFSVITVLAVPALVWMARTHQVRHHRRIARNLTAGALLLAGVFTLLGERTLGRMLWG